VNSFANEEVVWQRMQDLQREVEYSRLVASHGLPAALHLVLRVGRALRRATRRRPVAMEVECGECGERDAASEVA
jgi:hypothetical protein